MVPGITYDNVARAAVGTASNPTGPLLTFRNACLALLVFAYTVAASDSTSPSHDSSSTTKKSQPPEHLPSPADPGNPAAPATLSPPEVVTSPQGPSAKAGQKPPIQPTLPNSENPSPSHSLPSRQQSTGQLPSPSSFPEPPAKQPQLQKQPTEKPPVEHSSTAPINLLRILGEQPIMVRVVVAEVNRAALRSLGVDFGISDRQVSILTTRPAAAGASSTLASSTIAHNGWIVPFLKTLQELSYARFLAEPTLTTRHGQAARFQAGGKFPIPIVSPSPQGAVQDVAVQSYGVRLSIQPVIADLDRIRLSVDAEVSGTDPQATAPLGGTTVSGLTVRHFQSTVELREGESLAIAGLIRGSATTMLLQNSRSGSGVDASADHELVVLISPLLHSPSDEAAGGTHRLNPQDIELYLRNRNTLLPRGDDLYLLGPQGYAGGAHAHSAMRR
jgi:hypothetical protein